MNTAATRSEMGWIYGYMDGDSAQNPCIAPAHRCRTISKWLANVAEQSSLMQPPKVPNDPKNLRSQADIPVALSF